MGCELALVDLKLSKKDRKEEMQPAPSNGPDYPYGTSLTLDTDELKKLGISDLPEVGDEYTVNAIGKVTRVSSNASGSAESQSMELQITKLELVDADEEQDSYAEDRATRAERAAVGTKTVLSNSYRGRG